MTKKKKERLPAIDGGEKAKKIWEEGRKKKPSSDLVRIIEDSQTSDYSEEVKRDRAARKPDPEKQL